MTKSPALRVALGAQAVSVWSTEIFGRTESSRVRDFVSRAFAVQEVEGIELQRGAGFGRIRHASVANPSQLWRKLSHALNFEAPSRSGGVAHETIQPVDAGFVYLDAPGTSPIRITRVGAVLSTWRVRQPSANTLRVWHPYLRNRADVMFRLEEELAAILGVEDFRGNVFRAGASIRFDKNKTTAERVALELEKAWPRLVDGLDGPPSQKRFASAVGLLGLAAAGQFFVPALRPVAVAGVVLYGAPNVVNAIKDGKRKQIGLAALYSTGLAFMLFTGLPFTAGVMATLMQFWPHYTRRKMVLSQRRLFAGQRQRPAWARVTNSHGVEVEVNVHELHQDDLISVRAGEVIPVDGVVEDGSAVVDEAPFGGSHVVDRSHGDVVAAGSLVRDGSLTLRVERVGTETIASYVDSLLPHANFIGLPAAQEAERVANSNAKPALALAALNLLLRQTLRPSPAIIRPDYATGPRLSAQLSTLRGVAQGWQRGALFRNPSALDRLASADVYVIDDSAGLELKTLKVVKVETIRNVSTELVLGYALTAQRNSRSEQSRALRAFATSGYEAVSAQTIERRAGVRRYRDALGSLIEVAAPSYLAASKPAVARRFRRLLSESTGHAHSAGSTATNAQALQPLWVLRDGKVVGVVSFARTGDVIGRQFVAALRAYNQHAQIVYISQQEPAATLDVGDAFGVDDSHGDLRPADKLALVRNLARNTLWIGDGSAPDARQPIAASAVSISIAPLSRLREDAADILLPYKGLEGILEVLALSHAHARRLARDYRTVYTVNVAGVASAVLAGVTPLQVGLLSNFGTGLIYARHAAALERLSSRADEHRARVAQTPTATEPT